MGIKNVIKKILPKPKNTPILQICSNGEELLDKVAVITGGSGGIGLAIAKELLQSGAKVIITGTSEKKLKALENSMNDSNFKTMVLNYDNPQEFDDKVDKLSKIFGTIDILVCSSGIHVDRKGLDFINTTIEEYDSIMSINLRGTYFICQSVAKYMIKNKINGHILIISSQSALEPSWSPYRLSKLGIDGITRGMAQRLLEYGIIVNAIGPGPTATSMQKEYKNNNIYTYLNPIERFTMPEEVAQYAKLLVSDLGNTIIGQTIYMSGGRGIIDVR